VQLHKYGEFVQLYTRGGHKAARRFSDPVAALARIPARSCVIDGEVVTCNTRGLPDFHVLHFLSDGREVCLWAFDLLYLDDKDVRGLPLVERKALLARLVHRAADSCLRLSETFDDGVKLLAAAEKMGLEGVVSKRRDAPYRSGARSGWIKVKTLDWFVRNRDRWRLFERR
jgi:bifunctional non-homologous end joining protein LigD